METSQAVASAETTAAILKNEILSSGLKTRETILKAFEEGLGKKPVEELPEEIRGVVLVIRRCIRTGAPRAWFTSIGPNIIFSDLSIE